MCLIKEITKFFVELNSDAYLINTYVREKLIKSNLDSKKIEILYSGDIYKLYKLLKQNLNYYIKFYNNKRMVVIEYNDITLEIIELLYNTIEEYLKNSDYTINAIALKLVKNKIIDPYQGRLHIKRRIIQEVNDKSIENNPINILKGIFYYIRYGMHFSINTELDIKKYSKDLKGNFQNEIMDELLRIINVDKNGIAFNVLDQYGVLENLLPYVSELKILGKCKYNVEDVFTHMNAAYEIFKEIQYKKIELNGLDIDLLNKSYLGENKLIDILALAVFVHDIGKFKSYRKENDKISFAGHEIAGENIMRDVCKRLGFPKNEENLICNVIRGHMYPLKLFKIKSDKDNFKIELDKFIYEYKDYIKHILIASYCDISATNIYYNLESEMKEYKIFIEELLKIK